MSPPESRKWHISLVHTTGTKHMLIIIINYCSLEEAGHNEQLHCVLSRYFQFLLLPSQNSLSTCASQHTLLSNTWMLYAIPSSCSHSTDLLLPSDCPAELHNHTFMPVKSISNLLTGSQPTSIFGFQNHLGGGQNFLKSQCAQTLPLTHATIISVYHWFQMELHRQSLLTI
jgi:hypothetical protein